MGNENDSYLSGTLSENWNSDRTEVTFTVSGSINEGYYVFAKKSTYDIEDKEGNDLKDKDGNIVVDYAVIRYSREKVVAP